MRSNEFVTEWMWWLLINGINMQSTFPCYYFTFIAAMLLILKHTWKQNLIVNCLFLPIINVNWDELMENVWMKRDKPRGEKHDNRMHFENLIAVILKHHTFEISMNFFDISHRTYVNGKYMKRTEYIQFLWCDYLDGHKTSTCWHTFKHAPLKWYTNVDAQHSIWLGYFWTILI